MPYPDAEAAVARLELYLPNKILLELWLSVGLPAAGHLRLNNQINQSWGCNIDINMICSFCFNQA